SSILGGHFGRRSDDALATALTPPSFGSPKGAAELLVPLISAGTSRVSESERSRPRTRCESSRDCSLALGARRPIEGARGVAPAARSDALSSDAEFTSAARKKREPRSVHSVRPCPTAERGRKDTHST